MTEKEFVEKINKHKGVIHKACRTYCKSFNHADLAQEILIEAWQSLSKFKKNCTFSTWLYFISRNVCISALRKQNKQPEFIDLLEYSEVLEDVSNAPEMVKQLREAIRYDTVINNIEEPYRAIFEMYIHGCSYEEISLQTGITENALRARICRIKKQLQLRYGKGKKY